LEQEAKILHLEHQLGDPVKPDSFIENKGNICYPLPCDNRARVVPRWIKRVGTGEVEMLAGLVTGEAVYIALLFIDPNYTDTPTFGMDQWFVQLLQGPEAQFHTLAKAACSLPEWAAYAKVIWYQCLNNK
jgi:hypothetical protein